MLFLLLCLVVSTLTHDLPSSSIKIDPNTVLVLWGTRCAFPLFDIIILRHGNRHPEKFLEENPRTWGFEGNTELTSVCSYLIFKIGNLVGKEASLWLGKGVTKFCG